jgi:hypothetical protein
MTAFRRFLLILSVVAVANTAVLVIRAVFLFQNSDWMMLPGDAVSLYAFWRVRHGHVLYEWLTRPYFSFTPYNFLFYWLYAGLMSLLRVPDEAMAWAARLPTLAFAVLGAVAQYRAAQLVSEPFGGIHRGMNALLAYVSWFGSAIVSWWALAIRPDVGAAALSMLGLYACLAADLRRRPGLFIVAGLLFAAAWSLKQSYIMFFVAAVVHTAVWRRSRADLIRLAVPFAAVVATFLIVGTDAYRFDLIVAQTLHEIRPYDAQFWLRGDFLPNLLVWGMPAWSIVQWARDARQSIPRALLRLPSAASQAAGVDLRLIVLAFVFSGVWVVLTIGKAGSSNNYVIEPAMAAALWCAVVLGAYAANRLPRLERAFTAAALMTIPMLAFVTGLLLGGDNRLSRGVGLRARSELLVLGAPGEVERRKDLRMRLRQLPPPIYIPDQALSLPWNANRNEYPAVVIDPPPYYAAERRGLVGEGLAGLVRDRHFATLVLPHDDSLTAHALSAGYRASGTLNGPVGDVLQVYSR